MWVVGSRTEHGKELQEEGETAAASASPVDKWSLMS